MTCSPEIKTCKTSCSTELKRCIRCLLPETHETISFDEQGVCNICRQQGFKNNQIDWDKAKLRLDHLVEEHRGKFDYDCIMPFSGGKDSTWALYYMMTHYKIKPLVVRFDHGFLRSNLHENTTQTLRKLGADFLTFTPNWKIVQRLMLQSFLEKGDFCWHCHTGITSYVMQTSIRFKVPLVVWGEPSSEYTAYYSYEQDETLDEEKFNRIANLGITAADMYLRLGGDFDERELKPFAFPSLKELNSINFKPIYLGNYVKWDVKRQSKIISDELGWKGDFVENVSPEYSYEKIECYLQGSRDYIKYIKRGYSRNSHLAAIDVRNNRLTPEQAKELAAKDGKRPPSLDLFLKFIGLTEEEFMEVAMSHGVSPYQHDPSKTQMGDKLHDFDEWCTEGEIPRNEALTILKRASSHKQTSSK